MSDMATYDFIQNKFPVVIFGNLYECPTKADILSLGGGLTVVGSYGDNECVKSDDIKKVNVITAYKKRKVMAGAFYGVRSQYNVNSDVTVVVTLIDGRQITRTIPAGQSQNSDTLSTQRDIASAQVSSVNPDTYYYYQIEISNDG